VTDRPLRIDLRHPLLLKTNDVFLLTHQDGTIPQDAPSLGLFYRDTCYLSGYALRLNGTEPLRLMSSAAEGIAARIDLTNRALSDAGGRAVPEHAVSLRRTFVLLEDAFIDAISLQNFSVDPVMFPISLEFVARFESVFQVRGSPAGRRGRLQAPHWDGASLRFAYEGADSVLRGLTVGFSPAPAVVRTAEGCIAQFELSLEPQAEQALIVTFRLEERPSGSAASPPLRMMRSPTAVQRAREAARAALSVGQVRIETPSRGLAEVIARSLADIALLEVRRGPHRFIAAGVPWFVALFGRDSLIPAIQCLAYNPDLTAQAAGTLAAWQGSKEDRHTGEAPGKILHELRVGEMANLREVPQTPSYASVDATLLFLIAIARHAEWTGSLELFKMLRPNIGRALAWLDQNAAENDSGYIIYDGLTEGGQPINQGWRDSGTGVLRADGGYPEPPLALVEVQGYAYQAKLLIAGLLRRVGEVAWAEQLEAAARHLRSRFLRDFWMEAEGCYCLAIERGGQQVASVTSNAAQVLWTGIATPEHAARVADRVLRPDMFSGWGIRTLSAEHVRFDPLAYQQGSVWPFDNALIVAGLRRYCHDAAALRVAAAVLDAARGFPLGRLPEFMAGLQRGAGDMPPHAPRADPLQAWSAGALPFILAELLGLRVNGFERRLHVRRPMLPDGVERLTLHDLPVGNTRVSLRFGRCAGEIRAVVEEAESQCELIVE
jgi:glycogen debranching enzyme